MWWNIIKDSKQVSRTVGGIDWEKETIPEKDEPKCKEKLLAIQEALKDWKPPNSKYKGGSHTRGSNISTNYLYQDTPRSKPEVGNSKDEWIKNENMDFSTILIQYDSHWIKDLSEEEACAFLESLKKFNFNSDEMVSDTPISIISVSNNSTPWGESGHQYKHTRPHCIILYRHKRGIKGLYNLVVGDNDKDYAESTIRELRAFIKQQL